MDYTKHFSFFFLPLLLQMLYMPCGVWGWRQHESSALSSWISYNMYRQVAEGDSQVCGYRDLGVLFVNLGLLWLNLKFIKWHRKNIDEWVLHVFFRLEALYWVNCKTKHVKTAILYDAKLWWWLIKLTKCCAVYELFPCFLQPIRFVVQPPWYSVMDNGRFGCPSDIMMLWISTVFNSWQFIRPYYNNWWNSFAS